MAKKNVLSEEERIDQMLADWEAGRANREENQRLAEAYLADAEDEEAEEEADALEWELDNEPSCGHCGECEECGYGQI